MEMKSSQKDKPLSAIIILRRCAMHMLETQFDLSAFSSRCKIASSLRLGRRRRSATLCESISPRVATAKAWFTAQE
eukprot:5387052-Pyramimonas_sp.AAC.1